MDAVSALAADVWAWVEEDPHGKIPRNRFVRGVNVTHHLFAWHPATEVLYPVDAEKNFWRGGIWTDYAYENWQIPLCAVGAYLVFLVVGQLIMRPLEPVKARRTLVAWNLMLSTFSFIGAARTVPHLVSLIAHEGFRTSVCQDPIMYGAAGPSALWVGLFIFSKIPELGDTVFLVLAKKPVIFLHWYHHVTVLLYTWHAYASQTCAGIWFVAMNFTVHAVMYFYYALTMYKSIWSKAADRIKDADARANEVARVAGFKARLDAAAPVITIMQLAQMFMGVFIMTQIWKFWHDDVPGHCYNARSNWVAGTIMYSSYALLFLLFAVDRYCVGSRHAGVSGKPHQD